MKASSRCGVDAARTPGLLGRVRADVILVLRRRPRRARRAGATRGAGGDGRLWLLRRVTRIPYWTKQREQVLKLGRRGLASALAAELALNI